MQPTYFVCHPDNSFTVADPQPRKVGDETPQDVIRDAISRARQINDYVSMGDLAIKLASFPFA